ncbi:MAG: TIGR03905 family TSCPD domain-containing protein [Eubacterium sp.]
MTYKYNTTGTCSQQIIIDINDDETIENVQFLGGCNGNLKGIASLVKGQNIDSVIEKLSGIQCGMKGTSCPDQLAKALECIKNEI